MLFSGLKAAEVETILYQAFDTDLQNLGGDHSQGDKSIYIYSGNVEYTPLSSNDISCNGLLQQTAQLTFNAVAITVTTDYSTIPYLLIVNTGVGRISKIELSGVSSKIKEQLKDNSAEVQFAFTSNSTPSSLVQPPTRLKDDLNFFLDDTSLDDFLSPIYFTTVNSFVPCSENEISVPETDIDWGTGKPITAIKIAQCSLGGVDFGDASPNPAKFYLYGIKVYITAESDIPSSINNVAESNLKLTVANNEMNLTEKADVVISSVSGYSVRTYKQVRNISLNELPSGMYIVKATGDRGETVTSKIVK
jgi:hypothetical protein